MSQQWFIRRESQEQGPLTPQEVKQLAATGKLVATDFLRTSENPEWRQADRFKGLFVEGKPGNSVSPPLPQTPTKAPTSSHLPPTAANVAAPLQSGLNDILSIAKQAKDLAVAHTRKAQIIHVTLPKAYLELGQDVFESGRSHEHFSGLIQRIITANDEIDKITVSIKERPQAIDLKGKLQSGAAELMAKGQSTKLSLQRDSLLRTLGQDAFLLLGISAGSPELVSPITSATEEITRLESQIEQLSSGEQGKFWQRIPLAVLFTVCCLPFGLYLVWLNPRLSRRAKWIWTGVSLGAFMVLGVVGQKPPHTMSTGDTMAEDANSLDVGDPSVDFATLDFDTVVLDRGPQDQPVEEDTDRLVSGFVGSSRQVYLGKDAKRYQHGREELLFVIDELINTRVCGGSTWIYGVRHGRQWQINPKNGQPMVEQTWVRGKRNGKATQWLPRNGPSIKIDEEHYENGVLHGLKTTYYATSGRKMTETPYVYGQKHGNSRYYADDGTLLRIDEWEQGKQTASRWVSGPLAK